MNNPISSDDLNAYVDGALAPEQRAWVDAQVAGDAGLDRELQELRATARLLGELPELTPRRSFRLGAEHARPAPVAAPAAAPGKILQFLPIVRSLSVAAIMVFMVVGGALFFDINGDTSNDSTDTFAQQNEIMSNSGVTESGGEASDHAEDAHDAPAADETEQQPSDDGSSMTSRGDAASAGDDPIQDLSGLEDDGDDVASADQAPASTDAGVAATDVVDDDDNRTSWVWTSVALGGLALALAAIWFVLAQVGRQSHAGRS
jgi:hypothetical protein